ncbi:hypothetical protein PIB30_068508, partial [Stylosanthes scabra]|nr:hypothetical protein [Stylosanthes scabra]
MRILDLLSSTSNLKVNFSKSKVQCSKAVPLRRRNVLASSFNIWFTQFLEKYLGVNIGHERASKKTTQDVIDKIRGRLASWKGRLLNKA